MSVSVSFCLVLCVIHGAVMAQGPAQSNLDSLLAFRVHEEKRGRCTDAQIAENVLEKMRCT